MKKMLLVCLSAVLLVTVSGMGYAANELRVLPYYMMPGEDDDWDAAYGIEAQYVIWNTPQFGYAFAAGIGSWKVNDDTMIAEDDEGYVYGVEASGSAMTFPVGFSVLYRPTSVAGTAEITLEGGLRYVIVDSNIDVDAAVSDGYDVYSGSGSIDIDNGLVGLIGADISFPINPGKTYMGFGAGYQFDISKGSADIEGIDIGDNELKAFYLRAGFTSKF